MIHVDEMREVNKVACGGEKSSRWSLKGGLRQINTHLLNGWHPRYSAYVHAGAGRNEMDRAKEATWTVGVQSLKQVVEKACAVVGAGNALRPLLKVVEHSAAPPTTVMIQVGLLLA